MKWLALIIAVGASVGLNILFKIGVREIGIQSVTGSVLDHLRNPYIWAGFFCAFVLLGSYLYAIRSIPIGVAYPFVAGLGAAGLTVFGWLLFGEAIGYAKVTGAAFVVIGVILLSQSS